MVTDIAVVNKLFRHNPDGPPRHNDFFSEDSVEIKDPDKLMKELAELTSAAANPTEKLRIALSHSENTAKKTLPDVEPQWGLLNPVPSKCPLLFRSNE